MMKIRGILLDFDGVLLDSFREGLRRIHLVCTIHDVPFDRDTRAKLFARWGLPGIELLKQCVGVNDALAARMYIDWEKIDKTTPPPLVPGAREALVWSRRNGFKCALVTSRHRENLLEILDQLDLERELSVITAREDAGPYHKPDPRAFRHPLETLEEMHGIKKDECIFIGDTPSDTAAGHKAEITTLVVQTGPYLLEHMTEFPVDLGNVLKSIDDLPAWIERNHEGELKYLA
jgi:phosphoglycolate phosphatase-like HAD superfamily hydrolase